MSKRKNTFLLKRSNIPNKKPVDGSLLLGELALNTADAILYTSGTTSGSILPIGWDRLSTTGGTISGDLLITGNTTSNIMSATTFYGDGSNLTGIISGMTFDNGTYDLTLDRNDGTSFTENLSSIISASEFTGNTSGNCISDFHVENIHGCTDLTIHSSVQHNGSTAGGLLSTAFGGGTTASGDFSHAEGQYTIAGGEASHAQGYGTEAHGGASHAQGVSTIAGGIGSHTQGYYTTASGDFSHAQGVSTIASGNYSHAQGQNTEASGVYSHAGGSGAGSSSRVIAGGDASFAHFRNNTGANKGAMADYSAILGGLNHNIVSGATGSVILGGAGINATTSNTVYVPNLNISTIGTTASVNNLGVDADGNVVIGLQDRLPIEDTRTDNENPLWYIDNFPNSTTNEFKNTNSIGLNSIFPSGTYCAVETITQWGDWGSAGYPFQIATSPYNGKMAKRYGLDGTTWSNWEEIDAPMDRLPLILGRESIDDTPSWYQANYPDSMVQEKKSVSTVGATSLIPSGSLLSVVTYVGISSVNIYQVATSASSSKQIKRHGDATSNAWSSWEEIGAGGGSMDITPISYTALKALKTSDSLEPGTRYYITDRDIWIDALDTDKLAMECKRHFRIVKDEYYTPHDDTSGIGTTYYLGIYGQTYDRGSTPYSSNAIPSTTYFAIWGGRMWIRQNNITGGPDTPGTSNATIEGGWTVANTSNNTYYESKIFDIKYDFDEDIIWEQSDDRGNIIKRLDITTSYIDITDWGNTLIYNNENFGVFNNFRGATTKAIIYGNSNNGAIYLNSNASGVTSIRYNRNNGWIAGNIMNGSYLLEYNTNNGNIGVSSGTTTRNANITDTRLNK